jgi:hypothetical protein
MKIFIVNIDGESYKVHAKDYESLLAWTNDLVKKDLADMIEIEYDDHVKEIALLSMAALVFISILFIIFA